MMMTKKNLNIGHGFISIGGHENHDKGTIQWHQYQCGSSDLPVGWLSKGLIVVRNVIG